MVEGPLPQEKGQADQQEKKVPGAQSNSKTGGSWPDSLRSYINNCYKACQSELEKDKMGSKIHVKIVEEVSREETWSRDWMVEKYLTSLCLVRNLQVR